MKKFLFVFVMLLLPLQGCYVDYGPGYDVYGGGVAYEPEPVVFDAPPEVIVLPYTNNVYVVPDIDVDLFFCDGWWWRVWEDRWYRSQYYNRGWGYYNNVPSFYHDIDPGWRRYYKERNWHGKRWNYERIPNRQLQQNWKSLHNDQRWEKKKNWGVQDLRPGHQRPETQPDRENRPQRPEAKPDRDYRPQHPETQSDRDDNRPLRPEAKPGRGYRPQSHKDQPAQRMMLKSLGEHQSKDANKLEEKDEVEKQVRKNYPETNNRSRQTP